MRIIFMGTPEFAVHSLDILIRAGYEIPAVITAPDRLGGRGRKTLIESDTKKYCKEKGLNVLQPTNLKNQQFIEELASFKADLQIVVAFRMLPEAVWNMPPLGTYNLHGSLLPAYRGAAPINWAVINGEKITGVTSFKLKHEIDTGSVLLQREIPVFHNDTAGSLHDRMKLVAADVVLESVQMIESGNYTLKEQDNTKASHAPKLNRENTQINFNQPTQKVYNFIRGLSPYPAAWMPVGEDSMKIYSAGLEVGKSGHAPGTIISDNKSQIKVACTDGFVHLQDIQLTGKRKMKVHELLNGWDISPFTN